MTNVGRAVSTEVQAVPLFSGVGDGRADTASVRGGAPGARRSRDVEVNLAALGGFYGAGAAAPRLDLTLFPGETRTAVLDTLETTFEGRSWIGRLEGVEMSWVVLTVTRGAVSGSVSWPGGHQYAISPGIAGAHVITELGPAAELHDEVVDPPSSRRDTMSSDPRPAALDDPSVIDLLLIYTPAARHEVGSPAGVAAMIDQGVSTMNFVLANSRVPTRVRLMQTLEIPFGRPATCQEAVQSLLNTSDSNLDEVVALRDAYGADLVHVFDYPGWANCSGAAFFANTPGSANLGLGVSVMSRTGLLAFQHELGHNMGARHAWYVDDSPSSAKGFVNCAAGIQDFMAVSGECAARGLPVSNIAHYSNPNVQYQGHPTGVPRGTSMACRAGNLNNPPCDADAALTMADSLPAIANHRPSRFAAAGFPPRNEGFDFRSQLEGKYRDDLRRPVAGSYADPEGAVVWTIEYLRYRLGQCSHEVAVDKVQRQVRRQGLPEPCGSVSPGTLAFPPRNETYQFRLELERMYRDDLRRQPSDTRVDPEGDVVWIQEYLRYRLTGCNHSDAVARSMLQVDGLGVQPTCR